MTDSPSPAAQWRDRLVLELAPTHGRAMGALRTASAAAIATVLLLYMQMPVLAPGIYLMFLISYDVPYLTLTNSLDSLVWQCVGVMAALGLVVVTDNDPMARVLGIAGFTFLSAFLLQTCRSPQVGINIGVFSVLTLTNWESHRPPAQLVYLSFAPILVGAIAMGCKIPLEYLFTSRDPVRALALEMSVRLKAVAALLRAMAQDAMPGERARATTAVSRLAFAGQGKMAALATEIHSRRRRSRVDSLPIGVYPMVARLLDQAASLGRGTADGLTGNWRPELLALATAMESMAAGHCPAPEQKHADDNNVAAPVAALRQTLEQIARLSHIELPADAESPGTTPTASAPATPATTTASSPAWFREDAFRNREYLVFAGKLSLSATLCYVLYNTLAWPGISTACLTVLIAGLNTSGASNQKLVCRLLGSIFGAVILGLGCQIFVWPYADTLMPFLVTVFGVSYLAAWIARGAHFGYVGLQIAFSFFLVAFQEVMAPHVRGEFAPSRLPVAPFTAPLAITQGRDRVVGILLALVVMWVVFHPIHPKRSVQRMRERLAHLLRHEAEQVEALLHGDPTEESRLREQALVIVTEIRAQSENIPYEFDRHVGADQAQAAEISEALLYAGNVFLHMSALAHSRDGMARAPEPFAAVARGLRDAATELMAPSGAPPTPDAAPSTTNLGPIGQTPLALGNASRSLIELHRRCEHVASMA